LEKSLQFSVTAEKFNRKKYEVAYHVYMKKLYGISAPINDKIYKIKIEFTESYGNSFKNFFWHESQRWEQLANGNYMLHFHCSIGRELIGFLALGLSKVKVHSPVILKNILIKKLQESIDVYKTNAPLDEEIANKGL
jgi:hypothetical protein